MGNNNFTENFLDGTSLTQAQLETALKSLTLDISNTTQMVSGSTSGQVLTSTGPTTAASFQSIPDVLGPFAIRNYGLSTVISSGVLKVSLKANSGADPTTLNPVDIAFTNNGATTATYTNVQVTNALSLSITSSATLGFSGTSAHRVYIYAINNAGSVKLAVSSLGNFDTGNTVTTTAMSASADNLGALYATAVLTVVPRFLGWMQAAFNSTGAWTAVTKVAVSNQLPSTGAVVIGGGSGGFLSTSTSFVSVTNTQITISTTGRPVRLSLTGDNVGSPAYIEFASTLATAGNYTGGTTVRFFNTTNSTEVAQYQFEATTIFGIPANGTMEIDGKIPSSGISAIDFVPAGTYTYNIQIKKTGNNFVSGLINTRLFAQEI